MGAGQETADTVSVTQHEPKRRMRSLQCNARRSPALPGRAGGAKGPLNSVGGVILGSVVGMIETMVAVAGGVILGGVALKFPGTVAKWVSWLLWLCAYVAFGFLAHSTAGWLGVALYGVTLIAWVVYMTIIDAMPVMPMTWSKTKLTVVGFLSGFVMQAVYFAAALAAIALREAGILRFLPLAAAFCAVHLVCRRLQATVKKREEAWDRWQEEHPCPVHGEYCEDPCAHHRANVAAFQGTLFGSRSVTPPTVTADALTPAERAYADALVQARLGDSTALASAIEGIKQQNGTENLTVTQIRRIAAYLDQER